MSMDIRTSTDKRVVPNGVLVRLREELGWGRPRLAKQFELVGRRHGISTPEAAAMEKQIYRLETGRTLRPTPLYSKLYCLTFDRTPLELFGDLAAEVPAGATCIARSHKFIPVFVGAEVASALSAGGHWSHVDDQWTACRRRAVDHPAGSCNLYLWPFGVVLYHLVEDLALDSVAQLAVWRRITYEQNMHWANDQLRALTGCEVVGQPYVLSLYWVDEPAWQGRDLLTALRLMCIPRVLVQRVDADRRIMPCARYAHRTGAAAGRLRPSRTRRLQHEGHFPGLRLMVRRRVPPHRARPRTARGRASHLRAFRTSGMGLLRSPPPTGRKRR